MTALRLFTVEADADTGEWIAETLTEVGSAERIAHLSRADTAAEHFDTFERDGETCAVIVRWADHDRR